MYGSLASQEQKNIINEINIEASMLQDRIFLNLNSLPQLVKVIPIPSDIKFDIVKAKGIEGQNAPDKVFLYNPWEKDESINYYWTVNSFQKIILHLSNPLEVEIKVTKIVILFEGVKPFSLPSKYSTNISFDNYTSSINSDSYL
jgi:hypothetical protein